jgi:GT2 family glycosyltransferase
LADPPLISILLPVYDTPRQFLTEAIESVRAQIYPHWELCIVDDHSTDESIAEYLEEVYQSDTRIKFERRSENGHISAASNSALALATGSWVACLDHDDTLAEHALACFALEIVQHPEVGFIYSDEDKISASGERQDPFFKPKFDPLLLLGQNYLCHLSMFRRELINQVGGYREGYEGSQDWDLALRVTELIGPDAVAHIPRILYHWRIHPASTAHSLGAKAYAANTGEMAVRDHLERIGASGQVIPMAFIGWNRVKWTLPDPAPLVSIVIPTRDGKYLSRCIDSIRHRTTYPNYEVLVVDNGSLTRDVLEYLRSHDSWVKVIRDDNPFNYPAINNRAVARSDGEVICLLNDDTEVQGGDWLEEMVGQLSQSRVGAVGAKLYYSNGLVQHAGVILGIGGVAGHIFKLSDRLSFADHGRMQLPRTYSVVTAACMVVRREAWDQVGGMDEVNLPVAFNDVDFCLRLGEAGWRVVWTPFAELTHHESISRGPDTEGESAIRFSNEIRYMKQHWNSALLDDPAYNQNLTLVDQNLSPSWPPRVPRI